MQHFTRHPKFQTLIATLVIASAATAGAMAQQTTLSTAEAVAAAPWAENVQITIDGDVVRYQSDGLPDHAVPDRFVVPADGNQPPFSGDATSDFIIVDTAEFLQSDPVDELITLTPRYSDTTTDTPLGIIGVALSGARIFNDYETPNRSVVALDDNLQIDGASFVDACNAHPLQSGLSYHYHGVPFCITKAVDTQGQHSAMIGLLLDGFPVYGPQGPSGTLMSNSDLDACSGHREATPEFPDEIYHYHLTIDEAPYSIDCFHGVVEEARFDNAGGPGGADGGPPDLAAAAEQLGVSQAALAEAIGNDMPPDFAQAAEILGIDIGTLRSALPSAN